MAPTEWPEIMLFMQTEVLSGFILITTPEGRLLDELNGRSLIAPENRDKFLTLTEVTIWHADGTAEKAPLAHVNKANIQMAGTKTADSSRGIGAKPGAKPYPFTEKIPVMARIEMPGYMVTGNMYRVGHQQMEHVLKERTAFVPLTDVEINSIANGKQWHLAFLAVNKEQILSLHE